MKKGLIALIVSLLAISAGIVYIKKREIQKKQMKSVVKLVKQVKKNTLY